MSVACGNPNCLTPLEEPNGLPPAERKPCPNCGTLTRTISVEAAVVARAVVSAAGSVERGLNDTRLAVLGILVTIGLTVGFGIDAAWPWRVVAGVGSFAFAAFLIWWRWSRHRMMDFMHRITDR
jgi:hypothetical protein